jgi:hypothetical protein
MKRAAATKAFSYLKPKTSQKCPIVFGSSTWKSHAGGWPAHRSALIRQ